MLGASFSSELVGEVLADDSEASADSDAWDRLAEFVERDPYTPGAFRFRHALFRDAAYEGLSYKRRGELHAKVGEAYERLEGEGRGEFAELLSLHFFHAGDAEKSLRATRSSPASARRRSSRTSRRRASTGAQSTSRRSSSSTRPKSRAPGRRSAMSASSPGLYADAEEAYATGARARLTTPGCC